MSSPQDTSSPQEIAYLLSKLIAYLYDMLHEDIENLLKNNEDAINAITELIEEITKCINLFKGIVDPNYDFIFIFTNYLYFFFMALRETPKDTAKFSNAMPNVMTNLSAHLKSKDILDTIKGENKIHLLEKLRDLFLVEIARLQTKDIINGKFGNELIKKINDSSSELIKKLEEEEKKKKKKEQEEQELFDKAFIEESAHNAANAVNTTASSRRRTTRRWSAAGPKKRKKKYKKKSKKKYKKKSKQKSKQKSKKRNFF